ncbi:MAG: DUF4159 domain-containing protein [Planctomyces sp.]|nr:DUF4159 domain-containing protein [Planctomyces sp.]
MPQSIGSRAAAAVLTVLILTAGGAFAQNPLDALRSAFRSLEDDLEDENIGAQSPEEAANAPGPLKPGVVNAAILTYGAGKTSRCFSNEFLSLISRESHIQCNPKFVSTNLESSELFECPFAVMTGEGHFDLTEAQRLNMRNYLENGGFIIASAGCSSEEWKSSFRQEIQRVFPELPLTRLEFNHPVFHTVYDIPELKCKGTHRAHLEGLELDGKIVLIFSPDGLNDTGKAGPRCCCCGGNEIQNARQMNVNLLAYTLTH